MEKPLRGPALNEAVRNYVKQYILDRNLKAGDSLPPETQLAQQLGVGRSSVREAIKALQSLGIVEVKHGNGLYVREYNFDPILETLSYGMRFDPNTLAEFLQIRIWLESSVIGEAVSQIKAKDIAQLDEVMAAWAKRVEAGQLYADLDEQFHRILYTTLNNQTLMKLFEVFWIAFQNLDFETIRISEPAVELAEHRRILEAVKEGDVSLTRQRLVQHFSRLQDRLRRVMEAGEVAPRISSQTNQIVKANRVKY